MLSATHEIRKIHINSPKITRNEGNPRWLQREVAFRSSANGVTQQYTRTFEKLGNGNMQKYAHSETCTVQTRTVSWAKISNYVFCVRFAS